MRRFGLSAFAALAIRSVCLLALSGAALQAQDTAVVFVHGINSSAEVWTGITSNLQQRLRVAPVIPSLNWARTEGEQATQLSGMLNANPLTAGFARRMPFVAHSNGGLVTREYRRGDGRVRHAVTVGTPHFGAPLANNWLSGTTISISQFILDRLLDPVRYYSLNDIEAPSVIDWAYWVSYPLIWLVNVIDALLCPVAGFCLVLEAGTYVAAPVVYDLAVGSTATQMLNSSSNLTQEEATVAQRVGIRTFTPPSGAMFDLFTEEPEAWEIAQELAIASYISGYQYYRDHWDYFLQANAWLWVDGAAALIDLDYWWQTLTGTLVSYSRVLDQNTGFYGTYLEAFPSDGLVPHLSAAYPGGTLQIELPGRISHSKQLRSAAVSDALFAVLNERFEIPIRDGPPPPTYVASINGPTLARSGNTCSWSAATNIPDAAFQWSVDGAVVSASPEILLSVQSSFTLSLLVSNGQGASASTSIFVSVGTENANCESQ